MRIAVALAPLALGDCLNSCEEAGASCGVVNSCREIWCGICSTDQLCVDNACKKMAAASKCDHIERFKTSDPRGEKYRGCQTHTITGRECQPWSQSVPHDHSFTPESYPSAGLEANFCRNPVAHKTIWCITTDPTKRWEECAPIGEALKETVNIFEEKEALEAENAALREAALAELAEEEEAPAPQIIQHEAPAASVSQSNELLDAPPRSRVHPLIYLAVLA